MRIDHIAYRVANRNKTTQFFVEAMNYTIEDEFEINFEDGSTARCYALVPPERVYNTTAFKAWAMFGEVEYHSPPEIFVSEGTSDSIVGKWVQERQGIGGIHHVAYQVDDVEGVMREWQSRGWAEFTTESPITTEGLSQCFTKPHRLTGVVYEFIYRTTKGFNVENVKDLMESTV